jgi:hypothetical protein
MKITGCCHCGAIRYEADIDPAGVAICHCTDCQALSGSAFRVTVPAAAGTFRITEGTPRVYVKTADSGAKREQAFCERCGSPIYATAPGPEPRIYNIRAGTIDQRAELSRPAIQIWSRSRLGWIDDIGAVPKIDKEP